MDRIPSNRQTQNAVVMLTDGSAISDAGSGLVALEGLEFADQNGIVRNMNLALLEGQHEFFNDERFALSGGDEAGDRQAVPLQLRVERRTEAVFFAWICGLPWRFQNALSRAS